MADPIWGWTYERLRDGDNFHRTSVYLTDDAHYPPQEDEYLQDEYLHHGSYAGRIWCWYGRDMMMTTAKMITAFAGFYGYRMGGASVVFVDLVRSGAAFTVEEVYDGPLPTKDYCTEGGLRSRPAAVRHRGGSRSGATGCTRGRQHGKQVRG